MPDLLRISLGFVLLLSISIWQTNHDHPAPEKLGNVSFPISCTPYVQKAFDRGVALLHSFAYSAARNSFQQVADQDPQCAMAHWGMAMTYFHQLWNPPLSPQTSSIASDEIHRAERMRAGSDRERGFIRALGLLFQDADRVPYRTRALQYEQAMSRVASNNPADTEAQVFYALALLANAPPTDKTHAKQKQAADLLEPLYRKSPEHPGIAHYLIHAYDNAELAPRGLPAARAYAQIAPSAPHALHMPSHIFTRLGLWDDSIASNQAARRAAHEQGDTGEELHAMDYLVYAYLQVGRDEEARSVVDDLKQMQDLRMADFKIAYAGTAMPVRYAVERGQWADAATMTPPAGAPPEVVAVSCWARGLGLARTGHPDQARPEIERLRGIEEQLRNSGNSYWAVQVDIQRREVEAWAAEAEGKPEEAVALMRAAADQEDAIEKLPVTPGPIVPAREQLGYLFLEQKAPLAAQKAFEIALNNSPGRRGALLGAAQAREMRAQR
jgi:tetratricopeptide (TPR) repeat protein